MKKGWTHELTFLHFCIFDGEHSVQYSLRDLVNRLQISNIPYGNPKRPPVTNPNGVQLNFKFIPP